MSFLLKKDTTAFDTIWPAHSPGVKNAENPLIFGIFDSYHFTRTSGT